MTNAALSSHSVPARKAGQRFTRFVRTSLKPVVVKLSRKLSVTYWPQRRRTISLVLVALLTQFVPGFAAAAPTGGAVVAGSAAITQVNSTNMLINQQTQNAILNWQSFSIGAGEAVRFVQPNTSAVALNRVVGADPSRIFGSLSANGKVFLVNNAGVYFAPGAQVDVGALVASSMNISNANFMSGKYQFDAGANAGAVSNEGSLKGAFVVLAAPRVSNAGSIQAPGGAAALAAGGRVTLDMAGDRMVSLSVDAATANAAVQNSGNISAEGGKVFMTARSANAVLDTVINTTGIVRAASIVSRNGEIVIDGGRAGVVAVGGTLAAAGASGGSVKVLGDAVKLSGSAVVDVSGDTGGGKVVIGGDFHGAGAGHNATTTEVAKGAVIKADAIRSGDGGQVAVWSDDATRFAGSISAKGGAAGGNGGFVETSGKNTLAYSGRVDTTAAKGKTGNLLLDPGDIVISDDPDDAGVSPVVVNAGALVTSLQSSNIEIHTDSGTSGPGDITVAANLPRSDANLLTLTAAHDIALNGGISISNSMNGGLFLHADGAVTLNGAVNLNGGEFAVRGMAGGASLAGSIIGASSVATANGNVTMHAIGTVSTGPIDAGGGTIGLTSNAGTSITGPLRSADLNVNGGVSQTAGSAVVVDHEAVFTAGVGNNIVLGEAANDFVTVEVISANNVEMRDANSAAYKINTVGDSTLKTATAMSVEGQTRDLTTESAALTYGPLRVNRDLGSTATGAVNQVGGVTALTVLGTAAITATGQAVTLNHALNDFDGRLTLTAASATINDANALTARLDVAANATATATTNLVVDGTVHGNLATNSVGLTFGPTTIDGTLTSIATGAVGQTTGALTVGGTSNITATGQPVVLNNVGNNFTGALTLAAGSAQIQDADTLNAHLDVAANATLTAITDLVVDGTVHGNLATHSAALTFGPTVIDGTLTSDATGAVGQTGALNVGGATGITAAGQPVVLSNAGNDFVGALTVNAAGAQIADANTLSAHVDIAANATLTATTDLVVDGDVHGDLNTTSNALTFGPGLTRVSGNLASAALGQVDQTGALQVGGTSTIATPVQAQLTNAANDFGGLLTLLTGPAQITDASALTAQLNTTGAVSLTAAAGLTVEGIVRGSLDTHSAALTFGLTDVRGALSDLSSTASGAVAQTGALTVGGTSTISAAGQSVLLTDAGNNFAGALTLTAGSTQVKDANTLSAHLDIAADATIAAVTDLVVDGAVHGNLQTDSVGLTFGPTAVGGTLTSVATGAVGQTTGALIVGGTSTITATGQPVVLTNAGNDFGAALTLAAGSAQVADTNTLDAHLDVAANATLIAINGLVVDGAVHGNLGTHSAALTFGSTAVDGTLASVATGAVGQTAMLKVSGTSSITAIGQPVVLTNAGNDFAGALTINAGSAQIKDANTLSAHLDIAADAKLTAITDLIVDGAVHGNLQTDSVGLTFGPTAVGGTLTSVATGAVGQTSGALTVGGTSSITATGQPVVLTNAGNDFGSALTLTAGSAQVADANTLDAHLDVAANATLTAINGLVVDGAVHGNLGTHSAALTFGSTAVDGTLASVATGAVGQTAMLKVDGTSSITATGQPVVLTNAGNDFGGLLTIKAGSAQIKDANTLSAHLDIAADAKLTAITDLIVDGAVHGNLQTDSVGLTFGPTAVGGTLTSVATGAVGQTTGALTVGGTSTITATGQPVVLNNAGNDFGAALTLAAGSAQVADANTLDAHLDVAANATLIAIHGLVVDGAVHGNLDTHSAALTFGSTAVDGTLASVATGAVGQTAMLKVSGTSSITAIGQPVVLTNTGNDFGGPLTIKAGSAQITDANALTAHLDIAADAKITSLSDLVVDGDVLGTLETHSAALTYGVTTVGGNLVAVATGDVGQTGKLSVGGTTNISAAAQTVVLNDPANNFVGAVTVDATTVLLSDVDVLTAHLDTTTDSTVTAPNGLFVDGRVRGNLATHSVALTFGATKVDGNLVSVATGPVNQTGALVVDGTSDITATGRPVVLTHAGNDFVRALTLHAGSANVSDSNALTVDGTIAGNFGTISGALTFGATTVTGDLSAVANGAVGQTGILTVGGASSITATGQSVTLNTVGNHFGGALTLGAATAAIRDTDTLTAHLTTTGITTLTTVAGLAVDGVAGGLNADSAALTFGVTRVNGNLSATASGTVGQTGALTVTGASTITAVGQKVLLTNAGNDFVDALGLTAGDVAVTDANALTLATTKVSGPLSIVAAGTVSQTGTLVVDGATSITATGHAVTLDQAANDFVGTLSVNAGSAQIKDANTLTAHLDIATDATLTAISDLAVDGHVRGNLDTSSAALTYGATTVDGNLLAAATGNVGQTGRLAVGGTSNISAPGRSVVLTDPANDFGGVVTVNAADVQLSDTNVLTAHLDTSTNASVTAPGDLVVDGRVRGNLDTHSVALTFGGTKVDGNLVSVATGAVKQTGALVVDGTSSITANGQSVALADTGNDFVGDLTLNAGTATVADKNALTAHLSTAAATLSAGGALVLNGQVGGKLDTHSGALTFGTTTVTGDLAAVATGAVGQSGILTVTGASAISATGQSLMLANAGNDFAGDLTVSAGAAVINDANALTAHLATTGSADLTAAAGVSADGSVGGDLITHSVALSFGTTKVTGNLASVATGAVGQTGALAVSGASSINAIGHEITLGAAANDFGGAVTVTAGATTIADANALTAHLTTGAATLSAGAALIADGTTAGNLTTNSAALTFGPTTVTGDLSSVAGGAVGQTGALVVTGASAITASGQLLLLANAGNDFTGGLTLGAATATIRDANALTAHLTTAGATDLTAANALTVDGASGTLHTASNTLTLGTTKVTGDLVSNASGAVGQTGALTVSGSSRITATGQPVLLTEAGNNFVGTLALDAGSAKVTDKDALGGLFNIAGNLDITSGALTFGTSKIGGNLAVQAAGDVTQGALPSPALSSVDGATILLASLTGSAGAPISVTGTTRINAGTNRVLLADLGNDLVGAVSASGSSVTLRDSNILTVDKITAPSVDLGAKSELQMVAGGLVNADAIAIAVDDTKGAIGTPTNNFAVKPGSTVTFGSNMPAVAAYFAAFPAPFFAFKSDSTRLGYATNPDLLLVDNHFHEIRLITDGLAPFTSSISRILQAAQKRADSFADRLERGMLVKLDEAPFYQHYGQLALKSPACSKDPVSRRADGSVFLKGPDCEN